MIFPTPPTASPQTPARPGFVVSGDGKNAGFEVFSDSLRSPTGRDVSEASALSSERPAVQPGSLMPRQAPSFERVQIETGMQSLAKVTGWCGGSRTTGMNNEVPTAPQLEHDSLYNLYKWHAFERVQLTSGSSSCRAPLTRLHARLTYDHDGRRALTRPHAWPAPEAHLFERVQTISRRAQPIGRLTPVPAFERVQMPPSATKSFFPRDRHSGGLEFSSPRRTHPGTTTTIHEDRPMPALK